MKKRILILSVIVFIVLNGCSKDEKITPVPEPKYTIETITIHSPSLKNSAIYVDTVQKARVYLPPFYQTDTGTRYPVVYFIHGYSSDYREDYGIFYAAYNEMIDGNINEFIIVTVNSAGSLGGTFCVNSPVTGNWEDNLTQEVIYSIDSKYRTLPKKESRGIAGESMGGFGCLYLGLRHADIYNLVYAIAPGVLKEIDFMGAYDIWLRDGGLFISAYGAAFSPNQELSYPYAEKPVFDGSDEDNRIIENWEKGFGYFDKKIEDYLAGTSRLKKIGIDYGTADYYYWIPRGCVYLADLLEEKGIPYEKNVNYGGPHGVDIDQVKAFMFPFFSDNLVFE